MLDYQAGKEMRSQVYFEDFEFLSIVLDHDQQKLDQLFGLGLSTPEHSREDGYMNVIESMYTMGYIHQKQASIYIRNFNGADAEADRQAKLQYRLPDSFVEFGKYDAKGILKHDETYFWTVTSKYNWTLDLYGIQYGHSLIDLNADSIDDRQVNTGVKPGFNPGFTDPVDMQWQIDEDESSHKINQGTIVKALINPASPFISLPNKLFNVIAKEWLDSFTENKKPTCGIESCLVFQKCETITQL